MGTAIHVVAFCLFGDDPCSSTSSVRIRCHLIGRLSIVDAARELDAASESLWFSATRDLCDK